MAHRNARLTVYGRRLLVQRVVEDRRPVAHVVTELGCSRATGYKWLARWRAEGDAGLADRPSTAHRLPGKTSPATETRICELRTRLKRGPRRLAPLLGVAVHAAIDDHTRPAYAEIHPDDKPKPASDSYAAPPHTSPPSASLASNGS